MPEQAAAIAVLIVGRPLCLGCITAKTALTPAEVTGYLLQMGRTLRLRRSAGDRCRACDKLELVYSLIQPPV